MVSTSTIWPSDHREDYRSGILSFYNLVQSNMPFLKCHSNRTAFNKARVGQSVEHYTRNLKVMSSSRTVGKNFSFCILLRFTRSWQVDWSNTNESKLGILGNRCIKRIIINFERKMATVPVPSSR